MVTWTVESITIAIFVFKGHQSMGGTGPSSPPEMMTLKTKIAMVTDSTVHVTMRNAKTPKITETSILCPHMADTIDLFIKTNRPIKIHLHRWAPWRLHSRHVRRWQHPGVNTGICPTRQSGISPLSACPPWFTTTGWALSAYNEHNIQTSNKLIRFPK